MRILTPVGYKDIAECNVGDEVVYFDQVTGDPGVNHIESIAWVDYSEWVRWHTNATLPPFTFYKINGTWTLNSEQSIWRNADNVCHVKHLVVGDTIFDDTNGDVTITSIEEVSADGWWRFDIDGDHSYIADGLTLHNASRFWVGGTGTWDSSTTTHWASTTGGAGGQSVPGSADAVTIDASSGAGTITVNFGGTITIQSLTCGAMGMTLDFSVFNNNVTLSTGANAFSGTGTGTRTINLGNGTWTLSGASGAGNIWNMSVTTNLTFSANSSILSFTNTTATGSVMMPGGLTYSTVSIAGITGGGRFAISGSCTIANLNISAPNFVTFPSGSTVTITNSFAWNGTSSNQIGIASSTQNTSATIAAAASSTAAWAAFRDMTFTGSPSASNSFDLGHNSGITITAPSASSGGGIRIAGHGGLAA